jgi:hypothetical protein
VNGTNDPVALSVSDRSIPAFILAASVTTRSWCAGSSPTSILFSGLVDREEAADGAKDDAEDVDGVDVSKGPRLLVDVPISARTHFAARSSGMNQRLPSEQNHYPGELSSLVE